MDNIDRSQVDRDYKRLMELLKAADSAYGDRTLIMMEVRDIAKRNREISDICHEIFAADILEDPKVGPFGKALFQPYHLADLVEAIKSKFSY